MADLSAPSLPPLEPEWFAVDARGHIALMSAGMFGALPQVLMPAPASALAALVPLLAAVSAEALSYACADLFEPDSSTPAWVRGSLLTRPPTYEQSLSGLLVELRSPELAERRDLLRAPGLALDRLPSLQAGYAYGSAETPALRALWRSGAVVRALEGHELSPTRFGLYFYVHQPNTSMTTTLPYRRVDTPRRAARVELLPTLVRRQLARARFEGVQFARDARVQPCAHLPCHVPTGVWQDLEGDEHPA